MDRPSNNDLAEFLLVNMVTNTTNIPGSSLLRSSYFNRLIDPRRSINDECGYPEDVDIDQYKLMYDREGVGTRIVDLFAEESWIVDPDVVEDEKPTDTAFEAEWKELERQRQLYSYMLKADKISGIGRFGILLLGIDDGKDLSQPVDGINAKTGEREGAPNHQLMYVRAFDESEVTVKATEEDKKSPRYSQPTSYSWTIATTTGEASDKEQIVHWSRVIHIAEGAEVYAVPRMRSNFNRVYDLRKVVGGSGEMFWKGGYPGLSLEMDPNSRELTDPEIEEIRKVMADYADGLQRYLAIRGVTIKSLETQVADPKNHVEVELELISIAMGVPTWIFMGGNRASLGSGQEAEAAVKFWHQRVARRENKYLTPHIVRPTIDRLIAYGTLPEAQYNVVWPDLDTQSEMERAELLKALMEAWAKYVAGNVEQHIAPADMFSMFMKLEPDQVTQLLEGTGERERSMDAEEEEE